MKISKEQLSQLVKEAMEEIRSGELPNFQYANREYPTDKRTKQVDAALNLVFGEAGDNLIKARELLLKALVKKDSRKLRKIIAVIEKLELAIEDLDLED